MTGLIQIYDHKFEMETQHYPNHTLHWRLSSFSVLNGYCIPFSLSPNFWQSPPHPSQVHDPATSRKLMQLDTCSHTHPIFTSVPTCSAFLLFAMDKVIQLHLIPQLHSDLMLFVYYSRFHFYNYTLSHTSLISRSILD